MSSMLNFAGSSSTTWSITIPQTNGNTTSPINNTTTRMYGKTTSTYIDASSSKAVGRFTLAS